MDEFGVLTERYGLKPQGKSAPMAASKRSTVTSDGQAWNFESSSGKNTKSSSYSSNSSWNSKSVNGSFFDNDDILLKPSSTNRISKNSSGFDDFDVFGGLNKSSNQSSHYGSNMSSFDNDSLFSNFAKSGTKDSVNGFVADDIFGGMPGVKRTSCVINDDQFGQFVASSKQNAGVDDLLDDFGRYGPKSTSSTQNASADSGNNFTYSDELIPGFGGSGQANNWATKSTSAAAEDPFVVLESVSASVNTSSSVFVDPLDELVSNSSQGTKPVASPHTSSKLRPPPKPAQKVDKVKSSSISSIDELEAFAMGRVQHNPSASHNAREAKEKQSAKSSRYNEAEDASLKTQQNGIDDIESFFAVGTRSNSVPRSRATNQTLRKGGPEVAKKTSSGVPSGTNKAPSPAILADDFLSMFGEPLSGKFEEVPGESKERRRARLDRHQRTEARVAKAVADMNQRDQQTYLEQEERRRIAETLDAKIKHWAAGREGNMRALLSSLQNVLWPECGWEPVSLTDLITSAAVKKVYRKATLYVHPDKVQQKGATLQQKYTAEKVFDILKEAWNKFNKEELS